MKRTCLLVLALAVMMIPAGGVTASDQTAYGGWDAILEGTPGHMDITVGPDAIRFTLSEITLEDEDAAQLRHLMDSAPIGDGDGLVSEGEVMKFEGSVLAFMNSWVLQSYELDMVTIDGQAPYSEEHRVIRMESVDIQGAEGDVLSTKAITAEVNVLLRFETTDTSLSSHQLRLENIWGDFGFQEPDEDLVDKEVRIQGYRSWEIQADSITPAPAQENLVDGMLVFTTEDVALFEQQGEALEFEIQGDPSHRMLGDTEEAPAFLPLVVIALVLGGVLALRRRG